MVGEAFPFWVLFGEMVENLPRDPPLSGRSFWLVMQWLAGGNLPGVVWGLGEEPVVPVPRGAVGGGLLLALDRFEPMTIHGPA